MEAINQQINLGALICAKLKNIYFLNGTWSIPMAVDIGKKFTELKKRARKFYKGQGELEILRELTKYSEENIKEMFEHE